MAVWLLQIMYYDGQFDDARMAVTLACTAALAGATVLNHAECERFLKVIPHPDVWMGQHQPLCGKYLNREWQNLTQNLLSLLLFSDNKGSCCSGSTQS